MSSSWARLAQAKARLRDSLARRHRPVIQALAGDGNGNIAVPGTQYVWVREQSGAAPTLAFNLGRRTLTEGQLVTCEAEGDRAPFLWRLLGRDPVAAAYTPWLWGLNSAGQVGTGSGTSPELYPVALAALAGRVTQLSSCPAGGHTLALLDDGTVWAWGLNDSGQVGTGSAGTNQLTPAPVTGLPAGITRVAQGGWHSLALAGDGTVYCWGGNWEGQAGVAGGANVLTPTAVSLGQAAIDIAGGVEQSWAVLADGTVRAWGSNSGGALAQGSTSPSNSATPLTVKDSSGAGSLSGIVRLGPTYLTALAIASDGTVWGWGENSRWELGDGTTTDRRLPVHIRGVGGSGTLSTIVAVAGGLYFSQFLGADGTLYQCGRGDGISSGVDAFDFPVANDEPYPAIALDEANAPMTDVVAISSGYNHALVARAGGVVWSCGYNIDGMLGRDRPLNDWDQVYRPCWGAGGAGTLSGAVAVIASSEHSGALLP